MKSIGIFGGTFDPLHIGHLGLAEQVLNQIGLHEVQFLPCANPVHRNQPFANATHRVEMLKRAVEHVSGCVVNSLEIDRDGPSFTVDTLNQISKQDKRSKLYLLVGVDAYNSIESWKSPDEILTLANLIVCQRPGTKMDRSIYTDRIVGSVNELVKCKSGGIYEFEIKLSDCSSTTIRAKLARELAVDTCLTQPVIDYIHLNHLYEKQSD